MDRRTGGVVIVFAFAGIHWTGIPTRGPAQRSTGGVTVHEWGTFTSVAGEDGRPVDWLPLNGPADLPCFVSHFQNDPLIKLAPGTRLLDYEAARVNLWGKVRMETPVVYFYARQNASMSVRVEFPRGLLTEWYPRATVRQPAVTPEALRDPARVGVIEWPRVTITPGAMEAFPVDIAESHYYAARATDASPIVVNGQREKFLFYRGVGNVAVPIIVETLPDATFRIRNIGSEEVPAAVLFENRKGAIGYRWLGAVRTGLTADPPGLDGSLTGLRAGLERLLVQAGLYPKEAAAMLETWRDTWFEEGTRVFYIVPPRTVDAMLPLTISPAPSHIARVFVGRVEILTPAVRQTVERAIAGNDHSVLDQYSRFLGPITDQVLAGTANRSQQTAIRDFRNAAFARRLDRSATCEDHGFD